MPARLPPLLRLLLLDDANKPSRVSGSGEFADSWTEVQMAAESGHKLAQMWYAGKSRLGQERTRKQCLFVMYIGGLPVSATAAVISVVCCFAAITLACYCCFSFSQAVLETTFSVPDKTTSLSRWLACQLIVLGSSPVEELP